MRIILSKFQYDKVWNHLLPKGDPREFAAFMFADYEQLENGSILKVREVRLIKNTDFAVQQSDYFELSDAARIEIIKTAHQGGYALIELHSHPHPGQWAAGFSIADMNGFHETVPNMLWRLPERPYTAIVAAPEGFDALTWHTAGKPEEISGLVVDDMLLQPTYQTLGGKNERYKSR